ncbi:Phosphatidylinositol 3,4,5-trisphosphate 3-phosphatase TPTE2 [Armadillidium nasatum]|uniref:Phosphatidylinositol 3,4,5-trisphosphate 3-phosphatase TPTE2 n=1 Tax=Armadillidium nasatum TaxID=96803 RepID=A0A5N5TCM6_9CRUS|nr:Phosphatidylinositol 3,4,5-trisphosphate 3-phosphatase TPTE2 [Armadillidium nasatum]
MFEISYHRFNGYNTNKNSSLDAKSENGTPTAVHFPANEKDLEAFRPSEEEAQDSGCDGEVKLRRGSADGESVGSAETRRQRDLFSIATSFYEYDAEEHELDDELGFIDPSNPPVKGCNHRYLKWRTRRIVEHFLVRVLTTMFIVIDMVVLIVDLLNNSTTADDPLEYCSLAFSTYFVIEVLLRIFGLGWWTYFSKWYNALDFIIVMATFILSVLMVIIEDMDSNPANLLVILRLIRLVRIMRLFWQRRHIQVGARQFISQNKRRFQKDGFDLDLTYVAPRIIAMSFPSSGRIAMYRNDIKEVARFLNTKHKDHYRVYNLCSERHYDVRYFNGSVRRFTVDDHNVPSLKEMLEFSEDVRSWLSEDEKNVIAVHCKGGKGRTGTMICVVLIDTGLFKNAAQCLGYFGDRRTDKNAGDKFQGVETPSQSRYVGYYEQIVNIGRILPPETTSHISAFTITGISNIGHKDGSDFSISVKSRFHTVPYEASLHSKFNCKVKKVNIDEIYVELLNKPLVKGDTKVMFLSHNVSI